MRYLFALIMAIGLAASAWGQLVPLPKQPEDLAWPTDTWETAQLPGYVEVNALQSLVESAFAGEKADLMGETRALIIVHRGQIVLERYRPGFGPETKQVSWSMAKSVTHGLVGRAVRLGLIESIDTAMPSNWFPGDPRSGITWRQWLGMIDGLEYSEQQATSLATNDVVQMMFGPGRFDVISYVDNLPLIAEPGTIWNYSTAGFHLIGSALQEVIGAGECTVADTRAVRAASLPVPVCAPREFRFNAWAQEEFFAKVGMDAVIEFDPNGTFLGGSLVWASARDFAKFGYLYLRDGLWAGERILPEGWADLARTPSPAGNVNVYGSGFWLATPEGQASRPEGQGPTIGPFDAFSAQGHEGQVVWIVPSRDLVIVRLGLMSNEGDNWQTLYDWCQSIALTFPPLSEVGPQTGVRPR